MSETGMFAVSLGLLIGSAIVLGATGGCDQEAQACREAGRRSVAVDWGLADV